MVKHREESGRTPKTALRESVLNSFRPRKSDSTQSGTATRNKIAAAVVAAGAFAAIGQPLTANADKAGPEHPVRPVAEQHAVQGSQAEAQKVEAAKQAQQPPAPAQQPPAPAQQPPAPAQQPPAPAPPAPAPGFVKPAEGSLSSGFGQRSGKSHKGVDIANSIGTPIRSVADGKVVSAGPASGFGQWVRVQHPDGAMTVYGHINTIDVQEGQQVKAGQQIATLGNKGKSTGPHLHFEVIENGSKINPLPWLQQHGITLQ